MLRRFMPTEGKFFDLFRQSGELLVESTREFHELLKDLSHAESRVRNIKDIEHRADEVTHRTVEMLHKTFITPLDRQDIHDLISRMDDIVDFIDAASQRIQLYDIKSVPAEIIELGDICVKSAEAVKNVVSLLENMKNAQQIIKICVEINRLENEGDHALRSGMAKLFREETDTRQLIKLKEIYELLETVTDRCEDVANVVEGIVLEYA